MSIDPKKIDFSKMRPYQDLERNGGENIGEKISGGFSDYKNNSGASEEERQKYNKAGENNIFAGEKLMSVFGFLSISWKMFKERWKKFAGLYLLSIAVSIVINITSFILELFGNGSLLFVILGIVIILIFYIPNMLIGIAVIEIMRDKNLGVFQALSDSMNKLVKFFMAMLIGSLAMISVAIANVAVIIISFLVLGFVTTSLLGTEGGVAQSLANVIIWLIGFVFILLMLAPILIASIWLYFAMFAVVLENMSPLESLSYSYELMKKKMLSIVWKNIAVTALFAAVFALMLIAVLILSIIVPFLMVIAALAMIPVLLALIFIVSPVIYLFQYNIYENLKAIKKDKLPSDYAARYCGKIKALAVIGALIVILFILFSAISGFSFDKMKNETDMPFGSYFQNKTGEKDNPSEKARNDETLSEIKKRDEQRISDLDSISLMLWRYKEKNGSYPASDLVVKLNENNGTVSEIRSANDGKDIPTDPVEKYYYGYKSDGETYELSAVLENKNDKRCEVEGNFCIYRFKQVKVVQNEEELNLAAEDFSSPEVTWKTFLNSVETKNLDMYFKSFSKLSVDNLDNEYAFSKSELEDIDEWPIELYKQANYKVIEKTDKFAIMVPEVRIIKETPMPDFYFENEKGLWKIDVEYTLTDSLIRVVSLSEYKAENTGTAEEEISKLKENWRNIFK